jgi:hypothetical protein
LLDGRAERRLSTCSAARYARPVRRRTLGDVDAIREAAA